jgi:hypothetical protein
MEVQEPSESSGEEIQAAASEDHEDGKSTSKDSKDV